MNESVDPRIVLPNRKRMDGICSQCWKTDRGRVGRVTTRSLYSDERSSFNNDPCLPQSSTGVLLQVPYYSRWNASVWLWHLARRCTGTLFLCCSILSLDYSSRWFKSLRFYGLFLLPQTRHVKINDNKKTNPTSRLTHGSSGWNRKQTLAVPFIECTHKLGRIFYLFLAY